MTSHVGQNQVWRAIATILACILVLHSPLVFNPGYLSHDELQWAYFATQLQDPAFINGLWADVHAFQYRPLTFSMWMLLSRRYFEHPFVFHAIIVASSALNAAILMLVLRKAGVRDRTALTAGLLFGLGPYATYTHGWVATIADLIWVFCTLVIALVTLSSRRNWPIWLTSFLLTCAALFAKEAAVVIPALLFLAWLFMERQRRWLGAAMFAAAPVVVYLSVRLHTILSGAPADSPYAWKLSTLPASWIKFQLYPIAIDKFGAADTRVLFYLLSFWCLLVVSLWRAGSRYALAFILFGTVALGPVLIVQPATWYGYGFSMVTAAIMALAWPHTEKWGRIVISLFIAIGFVHSVNLIRIIHDAGEKQARFSPALAEALPRNDGRPVTLSVKNEKDRWIYIRMTHDIPAYDGVKMNGLVKLAEDGESADYQVQADGSLQAVKTR